MFIKNSQAVNNRGTMITNQTTLEYGANNVDHGNVSLNVANIYRSLYSYFVRIVILNGRIDSAATYTAIPKIILLVNCLPSSVTFLLKSARRFR